MATLLQMLKEVERLEDRLLTDTAVAPRLATMRARIKQQNQIIDELLQYTNAPRRLLERKHTRYLRGVLESRQQERGRQEQSRLRANASNARRQLKNWK